MNKFFKHIKTILTHKKYVFIWCFKMGIPIQGVFHDMSKFSPKELSQYKYYTGNRSPHDNMRDELGYSNSWYHHRNKNKHHWEYWVDSFTKQSAVKMPYKYVIEMFCDMCGASQAYNPNNWNPSKMIEYYHKRYDIDKEVYIINSDTRKLFEKLLFALKIYNNQSSFIQWYWNNRHDLINAYSKDIFI